MKIICKSLIFTVLVLMSVNCTSNKPINFKPLPMKDQPTLTSEQLRDLNTLEMQEAQERLKQNAKDETERLKDQPKVSNVFVEADIRQALLDVSTQTKTNIIVDENVQGTVSMTLDKTPIEVALRMILFPGGYKFRYIKEHNYYQVGKVIPESTSFDTISLTRVIKTNQEAQKVVEQISEHYKPYMSLSKDGNSLTLTGPEDVLNRLEWDIAMIDKAKRQIEISARFVLVQWEQGTNLGMQWGDINFDASGIGTFAKGVAYGFSGNVSASLQNLLQANGYKAKVDIIAEPRVVVEDGFEGVIKITREDLFLILSGGGQLYSYFTTKDVETGVIMKVKPFISRDGVLRLVLNPEISDIIGEREFKISGSGSQKLPIIARRSETTTVRVENGKTIAIGGLLMQEKRTQGKGIPGLSSIPVIGSFLLGGQENSTKDTELVIFITPRVIF
jgi:type II secretory pathway component GspD/PulD (secretin)